MHTLRPQLGLIALVVVSFATPLLFFDREALCALFVDDAFYYFGVAKNVAAGHGFTFDGLHATNGFHPLWMLLITPVYALFPDAVTSVRVIGLVETALIAFAVVTLYRGVREDLGKNTATLAALVVIALPGARGIIRNGMESALYFAMLVLAWYFLRRVRAGGGQSTRDWLIFGICVALTAMSRLEAIVLAPIVCLLMRKPLLASPVRLLAFGLPPTIAVASYLLWNKAAFGIWMPISSMVKSHLTGQLPLSTRFLAVLELPWVGRDVLLRVFGATRLRDASLLVQVLYAAVVLGLIFFLWTKRKTIWATLCKLSAGPILIAAIVIAVVDLFSVAAMPEWYQVPILLATAMLITAWVDHQHRLVVLVVILGSALLVLGRPAIQMLQMDDEGVDRYAYHRLMAADWLRDNTDPNSIAASWNGGMIGYFAERHVINLDGLVNDVEYYERAIVDKQFCDYLDDNEVEYLADQACGTLDNPGPYLNRFGCEAYGSQFEIVSRSFNPHGGSTGCPGTMVWKRELP